MERISISPSYCHINRHILFFIQNSGERINSQWLPYFLTPRILFQRALGRRRIRYYYINRSIRSLSHHPFCVPIQSSDYCAGVCRSTKETARSTDDILNWYTIYVSFKANIRLLFATSSRKRGLSDGWPQANSSVLHDLWDFALYAALCKYVCTVGAERRDPYVLVSLHARKQVAL